MQYVVLYHNIKHKTKLVTIRLVASKTARVIVTALTAIAIIWALYRSPWSGFGFYINPNRVRGGPAMQDTLGLDATAHRACSFSLFRGLVHYRRED